MIFLIEFIFKRFKRQPDRHTDSWRKTNEKLSGKLQTQTYAYLPHATAWAVYTQERLIYDLRDALNNYSIGHV